MIFISIFMHFGKEYWDSMFPDEFGKMLRFYKQTVMTLILKNHNFWPESTALRQSCLMDLE